MKIVVAGGGIAGNVFIRQLKQRLPDVWIRAFERRVFEMASPPGLNVLMNHNGCATIAHADPELWERFAKIGHMLKNWSARDMSGRIVYDLEDVVASNEASWPAMVARWDRIHEATRCDDVVEYGIGVTCVEDEADKVSVRLSSGEVVHDVDLVIAADGRYSAIREQLATVTPYYGPPFVADFRIVSSGEVPPFTTTRPLWRVYNKPRKEAVLRKHPESKSIRCAAEGLVRVGLMSLPGEQTGLFGNLIQPPGEISPEVKRGVVLRDLFEAEAMDEVGQFVLRVLEQHGDEAHWARKQQTDTRYVALGGKVLFIGDAAGAIYPSLGQGANLSLEDACVAAAAVERGLSEGRSLRAAALEVSALRTPRRDFISQASIDHARHLVDPELLDADEGPRWREPTSSWRQDVLHKLWVSGWPRASEQIALHAVTATRASFAPFGDVVAESFDGQPYDAAQTDALLDLSKGTPRFYLMKLDPGRKFEVPRITRHSLVTQCLGALGTDRDFYLVVHAPSDQPTLTGLRAFKVPPRHYVKLHAGTWHAGPLWTDTHRDMTFVNLELKDTNEVDHFSIDVRRLPVSPTDHTTRPYLDVIPVIPMVTQPEKTSAAPTSADDTSSSFFENVARS